MKKIKNLIVMIFTFLFIIPISSCKIVKNSEFEIVVPEIVLMGDTSLEGFSIKYNDETISITTDMLSDSSLFEFYKEGTNTISITYNNVSKDAQISVVRRDFDVSVTLKDQTFTYDAKIHKVEVEGILPADATIYYPLGNEFTNVGEYEVEAIVSAPYYKTMSYKANVKVINNEAGGE